jgi:Cyclin-dependent kinase regulatory subunit
VLHRYSDNDFEYRHVQLPKAMLKAIPKEYFMDPNKGVLKLLWEEEWRALGITQVRYFIAKSIRDILTHDRVLGGSTTKFMSQSHISSYSSMAIPLSLPRDILTEIKETDRLSSSLLIGYPP